MRKKVKDKLLAQKESIMDNFNFSHVLELMEWSKALYLEGEYSKWNIYIDGDMRIPTLLELKDRANHQLEQVIKCIKANPKQNFYFIHSGPFKTIYWNGILSLECVFEEWWEDE